MTERQQQIDDQRAMLDFLEENPELEVNFSRAYKYFYGDDKKDQFLGAVKSLGSFKKSIDGNDIVITKTFGSAKFEMTISRSKVCKKVTVMKEVEEWECEPLLSAAEMSELEAA